MRRVWRARTLTERFAFPTRDLLGVQDEHIGIADSNGGQLAVFAASILSATVVTFGQPIRHDTVGPEEAAGEPDQEHAERQIRASGVRACGGDEAAVGASTSRNTARDIIPLAPETGQASWEET